MGCHRVPSSQGGREREPPWGRRPQGGVGLGSYPGGVSIPDRARDTQTDEIVALKKVRMDKEKDGERGGAADRSELAWEGEEDVSCLRPPPSRACFPKGVCMMVKGG